MNAKSDNKYILGMIGLGTMGRNLMLNMAGHGFAVAGYDKNPDQIRLLESEGGNLPVKGFTSLESFINSLAQPRVVMMLVPAGKIVDNVIDGLVPLLSQGSIIIDGGNSHFTDTKRRAEMLESKGFHFFGMGISGGEKGARYGPSMMPGGDKSAYRHVQPVFEAIAAKVKGTPCVTYIGPGASGHFVKMVHNGIEYAIMELIAETYQLLKKGLGLQDNEIQKVFKTWNEGRLESYLLEITSKIFAFKAPGTDHLLLNDIRDEAKALGTGKWTSQAAMDLTLPTTVIDSAVAIRDLSRYKKLRTRLQECYAPARKKASVQAEEWIEKLENALYFGIITAYAQGMHLLWKASSDYHYGLHLNEIASIWRGGCIIRSRFLDIIENAFDADPSLEHLLLDADVQKLIQEATYDSREVLAFGIHEGIGSPAFTATLSYFDMICSEHMPANLIQAQRDFFGAHTYELIGKEGTFHTDWDAHA